MISTFVPSAAAPFFRTETFASHRREPSSMLPSDASTQRTSRRRWTRYSYASSAEERSGSDTISMSGVPARLRSTSDTPVGTSCHGKSCIDLPGVLLEVNAVEPNALSVSLSAPRATEPRVASGLSYCEIW